MSRNLLARILVSVVAVPVILWIAYRGGMWLFGLLLLLAVLSLTEFLVREGHGINTGWFWLAHLGAVMIFGCFTGADFLKEWFGPRVGTAQGIALLGAFFLLSRFIAPRHTASKPGGLSDHLRLWLGVAYVSVLYAVVYRIGNGVGAYGGGDLLLLLFSIVWIGDSGAMLAGLSLGRHQLAPSLSPNKTVEGSIGGIVLATVAAVAMHYWRLEQLALVHVIALSIGCSVLGQLGDLTESAWKRSLGIKDSSAVIPGHGGVLDRFDALLFAAPFMYAYLQLV